MEWLIQDFLKGVQLKERRLPSLGRPISTERPVADGHTAKIPRPTSHHHWGAPLLLGCCTTIGAPYYRWAPNEHWAPYFRLHHKSSTFATLSQTTQSPHWPSVAEEFVLGGEGGDWLAP